MSRIDTVYEKLKELSSETGVTTEIIANALGLSRANVSSDLNRLCETGKAIKEGTKPVLYKTVKINQNEKGPTLLEKFALKNPSLFPATEQAKAAILYPPKGMHILILGETGVGKSMFAELIHKYAVEMGRMTDNSPFVVFNCADYANNPQLLLSQLFGTKKGAYTGADADRTGLIEKANNGILFLDEVHRLPPEGQEMFFTFMDTGTYRRLGEADSERTAKVLIICATTENPDSSLLKTFSRRIPMIIRMPNLKERGLDERFNLISQILREESSRLARPISVSINSMKSFLSYSCPNNVGQLRTDIQLACAKAYADLVTNKKDSIQISSIDLPSYIREGLYMETEHRQLWNKLIGINKRFCIFDSSEEKILFEEDAENIYDMIDLKVNELKSQGASNEELEQEMAKDIEEYFSVYLQSINQNRGLSNLESIVSPEIIRTVEEIIKFSEKKLQKTFSKKILYGMAVHIASAIERIKRNLKIVNPQLNKIRAEFREEFIAAVESLKIINHSLDVTMPIDEAGFLAMFFVYDQDSIQKSSNNVKVIIITHGVSTATSMADTANSLLGVKYAIGVNAPLDEKPGQVMARLKDLIKLTEDKTDILFLVDMGSLTNFGEEVEKEFGVRTKTIPLVSTLHVVEATRKAMMGYSLEDVYKDTLRVNEFLENQSSVNLVEQYQQERLAIVTLCTTGEGGAALIKSILKKHLKFGNNHIEIIPINIVDNEDIESKLKTLAEHYRIICLVGSFTIDCNITQFSIDAVLEQRGLKDIQKLIDLEIAYLTIGDTLENHLTNVDGQWALRGAKEFVGNIEKSLGIKIETSVLIGIVMHIGCMIDRLKGGGSIDGFAGKDQFIQENPGLYTVIKQQCQILNHEYQISISDDEVCHLMLFFNPDNYLDSP